jgi:hypothetical protein
MISHLGTFDVENYGDLLYPIVFRSLLEKRDSGIRIRQFALLPGEAPQQSGFKNRPVQNLFGPCQAQPVTLVVGGGDILRTDWDTVAAPYSTIHRNYLSRLRSSIGTGDTLRYLLLKSLPRQAGGKFFATRFRDRWMGYPAAGPFLIDPTDLPAGSSVSYLSCGVPHDFEVAGKDAIRRTFNHAQFIYLRDEQSAEKLRSCGVSRKIHVAPDLIVTLSEEFNGAEEARKGREIFSRIGITGDRPVLCFQSQPFPGFNPEEIVGHLNRYRRRSGSEVVLLPIGYCHGDAAFLQRLAKQSGGTLKYANMYSVFDMISVIAASDLFVGTSLHGNITAFSFGIPHLFGPLPVEKAEGFLRVADLPVELKLRSWSEINAGIDVAQGLGPAYFSERAGAAKAKVYRVIDELLTELYDRRRVVK